MVQAVIFDLDGTLVDSLADIAASTNACLVRAGLATHDDDAIRSFVGHGIGALVDQALGERGTPARVQSMLSAIRAHYHDHCIDRTRPYPGIEAVLDALHRGGTQLAVVSNKPHGMTQRIVDALLPDVAFGFVTGERPAVPRKPDPTGLLLACAALQAPPSRALYVGDTPVDIEAARAAGVRSAAVTWGFRDRHLLEANAPDHLIDTPEQILSLL